MRISTLTLLLGSTIAAGSCGSGRAVIVVDVLSFIRQQALGDTIPYTIPTGVKDSVDRPPFATPLIEGLANSTVDSVQLTIGVDVHNYSGGPGQIKFQAFFGDDSATVFTSSHSGADSVTVNGAQVATLGPTTQTIATSGDSTFTLSKVWVGLRASVDASGAGSTMNGRVQVSVLQLRVILKDKVF